MPWGRARKGVAAYARVLVAPAVLLLAWVVAGPYLLAQAVRILSAPNGLWRAALAVYVLVGVVLLLRIVRAAMRPSPAAEAQLGTAGESMGAAPKKAVSPGPASCPVPKRLMSAWQRLCRDYSVEYAEWVAAHLSGDETCGQVLSLAAEHHGAWSEANAVGQLGPGRKARHEAAHAVVAHELGCTVTLVSLVAKDDWYGHTSFQAPVPRMGAADQHFILMQVLLAGREADLADGLNDTGSGSDMERLVQYAAAIVSTGECPGGHTGPLTTDALVAAASGAVRTILAERAGTVDEVAALVAEHRVVSGFHLRRVLARDGALQGARSV